MGRFLLRRLGQGLLVVLGVSLVVFVAMRVFGDPAKVMLPLSATAEQRAEFEHLIGAGLGLAVILALPLGALAALRPGGIVDRVTVIGGLVGLSTPQFWLGLL